MQIPEKTEVLIGNNPSICQLVFECDEIREKHCGIRYSAEEKGYYLFDYTKEGISVKTDVSYTLFSPDKPSFCEPGMVLIFGNGEEEIQLL